MRWLVALLLCAALTACGGATAERDVGGYVSLGDSYTAGTGSGDAVTDAGAICGQINENYPRIVAEELGAELTDASCAGAETRHASTPQAVVGTEAWPPQLDAVTRETDLVTVSLGYNDHGYISDALFGCTAVAASDPTGSPCRDLRESDGVDPERADRIGDNLVGVLEQVRDRAPNSEVLVVGYPQPVPEQGTCPELPLAAGDYAYVRDQLVLLDDAMRRAAEETGATFVDVMGASRGHDICAGDDAWVNGPVTQPGEAVAFHPFARENSAVAELVLEAVRG